MSEITAQRLREVRTAKRLKQGEAAQSLGVSHALLSHYENGIRQPGAEFLCAASRYYGVSADYLLGLTNTNAHLPPVEEMPSAAVQPYYEKALNLLTGLYCILSAVGDYGVAGALTDYIGANLYRVFRPLCDIHGARYAARFSINSDSFNFCGASAMLSEASFLMQLNSLPPESAKRLSALNIEKDFPVNADSLLRDLEQVDRVIAGCNPDPRHVDNYMP